MRRWYREIRTSLEVGCQAIAEGDATYSASFRDRASRFVPRILNSVSMQTITVLFAPAVDVAILGHIDCLDVAVWICGCK